jgi:hypothetical protein
VKRIREELSYDRPPAEVFDLISTGAFHIELITHLGGCDAEIVEETRRPDGAVRLVMRQQSAVDLPGFARKLIPANTTVTQTFDWGPPAPDGTRKGTWSAEAKGAPVTIGGPTELEATEGGASLVYMGEVRASVPVVGGRLEAFAIENLRRDLGLTAAFTNARLASA